MKYEIENDLIITNLSRIVCPRHANRMVSPTIPATIPYPFFALFLLFVVLLDDLLVVVVVVVVVIVVPMLFYFRHNIVEHWRCQCFAVQEGKEHVEHIFGNLEGFALQQTSVGRKLVHEGGLNFPVEG